MKQITLMFTRLYYDGQQKNEWSTLWHTCSCENYTSAYYHLICILQTQLLVFFNDGIYFFMKSEIPSFSDF